MKVTESQVRKLRIVGVKNLDALTVYIEDFSAGNGKITIECFGDCWSYHWSAMGEDNTLATFFVSAHNQYLINKLAPRIDPVNHSNEIREWLFSEILERRKDDTFTKEEARELWDDVDFYAEDCQEWLRHDREASRLCRTIVGEDFYDLIPEEPNPEYQYISRIVDTVKQALKETTS